MLGFGLNEFLLEDEMVMAADPAEILHTLQDPKPWKILQSLARTQMGHLPWPENQMAHEQEPGMGPTKEHMNKIYIALKVDNL